MTGLPRVLPQTARTVRIPWWCAVVLIWLAGRILSTAILLFYANNQAENAWTGAYPSLADFSSLWDGRWYNIIAVSGYPSELPRTPDGHVGENQWAFLPVFPALARLLMVFGLDWNVAAIAISLVAGLAASLVFYALVARVASSGQALFAVALFSLAPTSPLLQLAYAESLQMLLIVVCLYFLSSHRYGLVVFFGTALAFTRPGALALALTVFLHSLVRFVRRGTSDFPVAERIMALATVAWLTIVGFAWPVISGIVTGVPSAYIDTELAWRSAYIGYVELIPFTPWFQGASWWATTQWAIPEVVAIAILCVLIVAGVAILLSPWGRRAGLEIRLWCLSYGLYVLAVFFPQSSTVRILAPLFPGLAVVALPPSRIYRVILLVAFAVGQFFWVGGMWAVADYDWTPP